MNEMLWWLWWLWWLWLHDVYCRFILGVFVSGNILGGYCDGKS